MIHGIHHITSISKDPQKTYDFYAQILGLKLIKKSVNQDDTGTYHLFFGDSVGTAGLDLTFFPYTDASQGKSGYGCVDTIMFVIAIGKIEFWQQRLKRFNIESKIEYNSLNDKCLSFADWDGQSLMLVESEAINHDAKPHTTDNIDQASAIQNFYGAKLIFSEQNIDKSIQFLTDVFSYKHLDNISDSIVLQNTNCDYANYIFVESSDDRLYSGFGTVHHIAFRTKSTADQLILMDKVKKFGLNPTPVVDRYYFKSVYFREPSGILYEIATDEPGFAVDEPFDKLGESLALPPFIEHKRQQIESILPPINYNNNVSLFTDLSKLFTYIDLNQSQSDILFLLHGTGGDEFDLLNLLDQDTFNNYRIISLRGNVQEHGMNRFFKRFGMGSYDQESIAEESAKFQEFVSKFYKVNNIDSNNVTFVGYSNGANMILANCLTNPQIFKKIALLHPANVLDQDHQVELSHIDALVCYGQYDQMITLQESLDVVKLLHDKNAKVTEFDNESGHGITQSELEIIKNFLQ
jgi:predicted esterase/catechol 2,3-dioxygenase-like lactoylglutathione lyase family enzyme